MSLDALRLLGMTSGADLVGQLTPSFAARPTRNVILVFGRRPRHGRPAQQGL
jgi:hypothetical protein